ncbi:hypothetical protein GCM10010378_70690 [Streptomyces viridochromogenes]
MVARTAWWSAVCVLVQMAAARRQRLLTIKNVFDGYAREAGGRQWALQHGGTGTTAELTILTSARDALQGVVRGAATPEDLRELLQDVSSSPQFKGGKLVWSLRVSDDRRLPVDMSPGVGRRSGSEARTAATV